MDPGSQGQGIVVQITNNFRLIHVSLPKLKRLVKAVCTRFKVSEALVSIAIVDDVEIRKVNKRFLNRDYSTDCLSFDLSDEDRLSADGLITANGKRGGALSKSFELVVNGEKAMREASLRGHSPEAELALYVTHGLLHNLGFDDAAPDEAEKMHQTEDEILQQLGYGLVFNAGGE